MGSTDINRLDQHIFQYATAVVDWFLYYFLTLIHSKRKILEVIQTVKQSMLLHTLFSVCQSISQTI